MICICRDVNLGDIQNAINCGCTSIDEIKAKTNACTGCTSCEITIHKLLKESSQKD